MLEYSEPVVTESIGRLTYVWPPLDLKIVADRITDAGTAELWFYHVNGSGDSLLHTAKANLLSTTTMSSIAKRMEHHSKDVPWTPVLTCISSKTMEYTRRGDPGFVIEPTEEEAVHPGYYVEPFIMKSVPNIGYGDKAVAKTTTALAMLGLCALGCMPGDTDMGLCAPEAAPVALLDWESGPEMTKYTLSRLILGKTVPWFPLPYLRCKHPLADDIDRIGNFLHDNKAKVVLIDSLGQAAGAIKFDSTGKDAAIRFFEALGQLNVTSYIIGQNAKNEEGKKSIFGSTYFTYYARNIFEIRGKPDPLNPDEMHIALFHDFSNYSGKHAPTGFNIKYTPTTIKVSSEDLDSSVFTERIKKTLALKDYLSKGAKPVGEIAKALNLPLDATRVLLTKEKKKGHVVNLSSGMWGLVSDLPED